MVATPVAESPPRRRSSPETPPQSPETSLRERELASGSRGSFPKLVVILIEFGATLAFVFLTASLVVTTARDGRMTATRLAVIGIGFGGIYSGLLTLASVVGASNRIVGLNPALTVATTVWSLVRAARRDDGGTRSAAIALEGVLTILAQCFGALGALVLLPLVVPDPGAAIYPYGAPAVGGGASLAQAFGWETLGSFALCFAALSVGARGPGSGGVGSAGTTVGRARASVDATAPLAQGAALAAATLITFPFAGGALNPVRVVTLVMVPAKTGLLFVLPLAELLGAGLALLFAVTAMGGWTARMSEDDDDGGEGKDR
jgi:hypothetical protein